MLDQILQALMPAIYLASNHLIELLLGLGVLYFHRWTGIQIDEKHMRALHSAALTGVRLGLEGNFTGAALKAAAIDYMRQSVPDAVKRLTGGDETILGKLVQAKLQEALRR